MHIYTPYQHYAGGGVGHYGVTLSDTPTNANETPQEDFAMDDDIDPPIHFHYNKS